GGAVTHNWSISGNGSISGSTTGASVSVTAGPIANGSSFTLTDNITRNGCAGQCALQVPIITCNQQLAVFKQVVCVGENGTCAPFNDANLNDEDSASGVKGATCPAFCYRITVVNTSPDVPLVDLTVRDPDLDLSGCTFPTSLAPGATASCIIPNVRRCSSVANTVTASAKNGFDATQTARGQDTATVTVLPISVKCDVVLDSSLDMEAQAEAGKPDDNHVTLPDSGPVNFSLTVT